MFGAHGFLQVTGARVDQEARFEKAPSEQQWVLKVITLSQVHLCRMLRIAYTDLQYHHRALLVAWCFILDPGHALQRPLQRVRLVGPIAEHELHPLVASPGEITHFFRMN